MKFDYKPGFYIYFLFALIIYLLFKNRYVSNFFNESKKKIKEDMIFFLLSVIAAIPIVIFLDRTVAIYFSKFEQIQLEMNNKFMLSFLKIGYMLGDGNFTFSLTAVIIVILIVLKKREQLFMLSIGSSAISGLIVTIIKVIITRERPVVDYNNLNFFAFGKAIENGRLFKFEYVSMPSGHTTTIVAAVVPLIMQIKNRWIRLVLILIPLITVFNRVSTTEHWVSDTLIGAIIGIIVAKNMYNGNKYRLEK